MSVTVLATSEETFALGDFVTASGDVVTGAELRYRVIGNREAGRANGWIVVFHALTGSADLEAWWGPLIGPGRPLDPTRHPIVSANLLGSCYGSTGPKEWARWTDRPFPALTTADLARAHEPLLDALGAERVALAAGGSLGGMVALEWGRQTSRTVDTLAVFAAPATTSPQAIAWNAAQRMAIEADPGWADGRYHPGVGPESGLAAARAIAMITYRAGQEFDARFGRARTRHPERFDIESYLRRQGDKLVARFDAASYVALMLAMDLHDLGDPAAAARDTAAHVRRVVGIGIDTDILYPAADIRAWVDGYATAIDARYEEITSICGHDAFLIEFDQVQAILDRHMGD